MKIVYWVFLGIAVALILLGALGDNLRWLIFAGVAVVLVGAAFNPARPFYGLRKPNQ